MVAACAFSGLNFDLGGSHACAGLGCPALAPLSGTCAPLSAVSKLSSSCIDIHSTATAFAPPRALCRLGCDWLSPAFLLLCGCLTSVGPVAFRSFVLRVSFAPPWRELPNRSLRVRHITNFVPMLSPIRMQLPADLGFRHLESWLIRCTRLTALYLRSTRSRTYGFYRTSPRGPCSV
jgi:hypothetical protein